MDDNIGGRQIEPGAPGFQTNEKDRDFSFLKQLYRCLSVPGVACQHDVLERMVVQLSLTNVAESLGRGCGRLTQNYYVVTM